MSMRMNSQVARTQTNETKSSKFASLIRFWKNRNSVNIWSPSAERRLGAFGSPDLHSHLIGDVAQHIVLQSADGVLHAQIRVRPEQRLVGAAVAEHQEHTAGQDVFAGRRAHANEAARIAQAAAAECLVGGRRVAVEGQRRAAWRKRHAQRMAAERQRVRAGAQLAAFGIVQRVYLTMGRRFIGLGCFRIDWIYVGTIYAGWMSHHRTANSPAACSIPGLVDRTVEVAAQHNILWTQHTEDENIRESTTHSV